MITYQSQQVRIISGDERDKLATIEWPNGKVRVVKMTDLRGTKGGMMEVMQQWTAACRQTARTEAK